MINRLENYCERRWGIILVLTMIFIVWMVFYIMSSLPGDLKRYGIIPGCQKVAADSILFNERTAGEVGVLSGKVYDMGLRLTNMEIYLFGEEDDRR